ncbi:alpha/beta hydrolase [bacterium]|nr:alpha/beta hydrolase [bacterium]
MRLDKGPFFWKDRPRTMLSVWLHGWATDSRVFAPLTGALSASTGTPCLHPNLAGHLRLERPERWATVLAGHLESVAPANEPLVLAGWSLGAMLALEAAPLLGDRLSGLILLSGCARFIREQSNPSGQDPRALHLMQRRLPGSAARVLDDFYDNLFSPRQTEHRQRLREELEPAWLEQDKAWLAAGLEYLLRTDLRPLPAGIRVPVLALHGAADRVIAPQLGRELARSLPAARLIELEREGHLPFWPRCGRLTDELGGFIADVEKLWRDNG